MKLAVLIDAENISSKYMEVILSEANALGSIIYKRIYGNWTDTQLSGWKEVILDNSIQPMQQYSNTKGKNSSDSSLIIDAMDLLYLGRLDGFCIVSSDSDFTRLAARLREAEMFVLGMGEQKTPRSFISACNKFSYLDILYSATNSTKSTEQQTAKSKSEEVTAKNQIDVLTKHHVQNGVVEENPGSNINAIKQSLIELTEENSDYEGWIFAGELGRLLNKRFPDFDVRNFGHKKFLPFVMSLGLFNIKKSDEDSKIIFLNLKNPRYE